jgi:hypothetical protein
MRPVKNIKIDKHLELFDGQIRHYVRIDVFNELNKN